MKTRHNAKPITNNYARHVVTGEYVFFADMNVPALTHPQHWAFFRVPAGQDRDVFRGRLVGGAPSESDVGVDVS